MEFARNRAGKGRQARASLETNQAREQKKAGIYARYPTYSARSANSRYPPEAALRQTLHQRLRLGDLGHLRRRREAFERWREDGVGFGEPAGRLVEFCERERGT